MSVPVFVLCGLLACTVAFVWMVVTAPEVNEDHSRD